MNYKKQDGISGIDVIVSVIIITIFVTLIGSMITNINLKSKQTERQAIAMSYAMHEIEAIKKQGYISAYDEEQVIVTESDIEDENGFTGYHKTITIKDYKVENNNDTSIQENILKHITVQISYKVGNKTQNVELSTYIGKR